MTKKEFSVHFMMTGGTIDSCDKDIQYPLIPQKNSIIPDFVKSLKLEANTKFTQICFKDSREISKQDLKKLLSSIEKSIHKHIIITVGTYAMSDVARFLQLNIKRKDQVIVLTGSMVPIYGFALSDGLFNIGYAISKLQELDKGVYICMHGKTYLPKEITKDVTEGKFTSIFG